MAARRFDRGGADTFAMRLRAAREHARMTPELLAKRTTFTVKRLQALEAGTGTPPEPTSIGVLASACGVSALWLMAGTSAGSRFVPDWYVAGANA